MGTNIVIQNVRGSHVRVLNPRAVAPGEVEKFSMTALISKADHQAIAALKAAQAAEIKKKWGVNPPADIHFPLHDGDGLKPGSGDPYSAECKGCMVLNVTSKKQPVVLDARKERINDPKEVASGHYFNLSVAAYAYEVSGRRGITFELLGVQVVRKGDPFGVRSVEDDFQVLEGIADSESSKFLS